MNADNYDEFRKSLSQADPRLKELKQAVHALTPAWLPWHRPRPRVVAIHLDSNDSLKPAATSLVCLGLIFSCTLRCSQIMRDSSLSINELLERAAGRHSYRLTCTAGTMCRSNIMRHCCYPHCPGISGTSVTCQAATLPSPGLWETFPKLLLQGANARSGQERPKLADGTVSLMLAP